MQSPTRLASVRLSAVPALERRRVGAVRPRPVTAALSAGRRCGAATAASVDRVLVTRPAIVLFPVARAVDINKPCKTRAMSVVIDIGHMRRTIDMLMMFSKLLDNSLLKKIHVETAHKKK